MTFFFFLSYFYLSDSIGVKTWQTNGAVANLTPTQLPNQISPSSSEAKNVHNGGWPVQRVDSGHQPPPSLTRSSSPAECVTSTKSGVTLLWQVMATDIHTTISTQGQFKISSAHTRICKQVNFIQKSAPHFYSYNNIMSLHSCNNSNTEQHYDKDVKKMRDRGDDNLAAGGVKISVYPCLFRRTCGVRRGRRHRERRQDDVEGNMS